MERSFRGVAFKAVFLFDFLFGIRKIANDFEAGKFDSDLFGVGEPEFGPRDSFIFLDILRRNNLKRLILEF